MKCILNGNSITSKVVEIHTAEFEQIIVYCGKTYKFSHFINTSYQCAVYVEQ